MLQVLLHQEHSDQQKHGRSQKQNGIQNFKWQEMLDNPAEAALAEQKENDSGCRAAVQELPIMRVCRQGGQFRSRLRFGRRPVGIDTRTADRTIAGIAQ